MQIVDSLEHSIVHHQNELVLFLSRILSSLPLFNWFIKSRNMPMIILMDLSLDVS